MIGSLINFSFSIASFYCHVMSSFNLYFLTFFYKYLTIIMLRCFVGVRRLELPTSTSRTWRASQLCYTPDFCAPKIKLFYKSPIIKAIKRFYFSFFLKMLLIFVHTGFSSVTSFFSAGSRFFSFSLNSSRFALLLNISASWKSLFSISNTSLY
jgi:hypothetical protein